MSFNQSAVPVLICPLICWELFGTDGWLFGWLLQSNHYVCNDCMSHKSDVEMEYWPVHRRDITDTHHLIEIDLTDRDALNELMIPSCSYRMGEVNIGYGVVIISK